MVHHQSASSAFWRDCSFKQLTKINLLRWSLENRLLNCVPSSRCFLAIIKIEYDNMIDINKSPTKMGWFTTRKNEPTQDPWVLYFDPCHVMAVQGPRYQYTNEKSWLFSARQKTTTVSFLLYRRVIKSGSNC